MASFMCNFIIILSIFSPKWKLFFNLRQFTFFTIFTILIPVSFNPSNAFKLALAKLGYIDIGQAPIQFSVHVSGTLMVFLTLRKLRYVAHVIF